ncbi:hypothetical protein QQF64_033730 [Cirrhinus molitorella]|uniref:Tc1-like transposase DDE domain-containing protein n=1 Tax=Cirrhinus molitorella TaxID=172907 RepID=A0ABR3MUR2_9TELE
MLHSGHAIVWVVHFFGASPHRNSPRCGKDSEGGLIREQYMFHIAHSAGFSLLAPLKLTFGIGTNDQRFGYSSPAMYIDPVELPTNIFGGNRRVEVSAALSEDESGELCRCRTSVRSLCSQSGCQIERLPHGGGRTGMFSPHQETLIVDMVRENNAIKLSEIQQKIIEDHVNFEGINSVSLSTVDRVLKRNRLRMKQLYRVPFDRNSDRVKEQRFQYVQRVFQLDAMERPHEYIYMDEAGFNLTKRRRRGCNVIGHRAIVGVPGQRSAFSDLVHTLQESLCPTTTVSAHTTSPMAKPAVYMAEAATCSGFLLQCSLYFELNPQQFTNDRAKVAFIISLLGQ